MQHNPTFLFSLAISPDPRIIGLVRDIKQLLQKRLGRSYRSVNSQAHITLFTFWATLDDYPGILAKIKAILAGLESFELKFSGFAFFPPHPLRTFYIQLEELSGQKIIKCCDGIHSHVDTDFRKKYSWNNEVKKSPHMSIGHELLESEIPDCNHLAKRGFIDSSICNSFVIRRFNKSKGQYDILDTIPLLGHQYIAGEQLRLF